MSGRQIVRAALPRRVDVGTAVPLCVLVLGTTSGIAHWHHVDLAPLAVLWLLAGVIPLLWRSTWPTTAFAASSVAVFSYYFSGNPAGMSIVLPTLALVTLAYRRGPIVAAIGGGIVTAAAITGVLVRGDAGGTFDPRLLGLLLWMIVAVAIGTMGRMRGAARAAMAERGAEAVRRRAEEERLRIAREVHDVVAHSLAMINVQAGVAAHVADRRPEQAKAALLAIKDASRAALLDLRATLGVLRSGDDRAPTPGLDRLPDLIAAASATGITITAEGDAGPLPAPVDVAVYRILQESLTNVVRHGQDADTVVVRFVRTERELEITVRDNGSASATAATDGNGLRGMAERAHALGGMVTAGPRGDGGFQVFARLPLTGSSP